MNVRALRERWGRWTHRPPRPSTTVALLARRSRRVSFIAWSLAAVTQQQTAAARARRMNTRVWLLCGEACHSHRTAPKFRAGHTNAGASVSCPWIGCPRLRPRTPAWSHRTMPMAVVQGVSSLPRAPPSQDAGAIDGGRTSPRRLCGGCRGATPSLAPCIYLGTHLARPHASLAHVTLISTCW